eukprot:552378-Pelagomonas_calceolata.AAC.3
MMQLSFHKTSTQHPLLITNPPGHTACPATGQYSTGTLCRSYDLHQCQVQMRDGEEEEEEKVAA